MVVQNFDWACKLCIARCQQLEKHTERTIQAVKQARKVFKNLMNRGIKLFMEQGTLNIKILNLRSKGIWRFIS